MAAGLGVGRAGGRTSQSWKAGGADVIAGEGDKITPTTAICRGFPVNAFTPKVALFTLAFLPQFTDPARGPVWAQILCLGVIFTLTGTLITAAYGGVAGWLGASLAARMSLLSRISAGMMGILALRLVRD